MGLDRKDEFIDEMSSFIVEGNKRMLTGNGNSCAVLSSDPGVNRAEYRSLNGLWRLTNESAGYFSAPGVSRVFYKDIPVWGLSYAGEGVTEDSYDLANPSIEFLKQALLEVTPQMPFRGPHFFSTPDKKWIYRFERRGDIGLASWNEDVVFNDRNNIRKTFTQSGHAGWIIDRTSDRKPRYPWEI
jgi:hypothetical protein